MPYILFRRGARARCFLSPVLVFMSIYPGVERSPMLGTQVSSNYTRRWVVRVGRVGVWHSISL